MNIEIKVTKLTKSKVQQMDYIGVPINPNIEVLGWVNMDKKRWVIVKSLGSYYRADFINKVEKEIKSTQFQLADGGYEYPSLTVVSCEIYNRGRLSYGANRVEDENIKLYNHLINFKRKTEIAGQIYY